MSTGRAFRLILASAFGGAFLGSLLGVALAFLLPNYYPSVFAGPVDPIQTGLGLGASQGFIGGALIGLGLVAVLVWREVRLREFESRRPSDYPRPNA